VFALVVSGILAAGHVGRSGHGDCGTVLAPIAHSQLDSNEVQACAEDVSSRRLLVIAIAVGGAVAIAGGVRVLVHANQRSAPSRAVPVGSSAGDPPSPDFGEATTTGPTRPCPWCAETIKAAARVCRYCGQEVQAQ
jgi:hypothetical protein